MDKAHLFGRYEGKNIILLTSRRRRTSPVASVSSKHLLHTTSAAEQNILVPPKICALEMLFTLFSWQLDATPTKDPNYCCDFSYASWIEYGYPQSSRIVKMIEESIIIDFYFYFILNPEFMSKMA